MAKILFWGSGVFIFYTYIGYPLFLLIWSRIAPRPVRKKPITPSVSLVICAYNEAAVIGRKIENCLALNYPKDKLEIIIVSDGSTDKTDEIVRQYTKRGVQLMRPFSMRKGKPAILNIVVPLCKGEIILFADSRQRIDRGSVRAIVRNFADPKVGAVTGELQLNPSLEVAGTEAIGTYWNYEKWVRRLESATGSVIGATGAIYAVRKHLFSPIHDNAFLDDVLIPLEVARRGFLVVVDPDAKAYESLMSRADEFRRKVRTLAGCWQLLRFVPWVVHPLRGRVLVHKIFRVVTPFPLLFLLGTNAVLLGKGTTWNLFFLFQGIIYGSALIGAALPQSQFFRRVWTALAIQLTSLVGLVGVIKQNDLWRK